MQLSHLVIRAEEPQRLVPFYEALGFNFSREKHGRSPEHFAASLGTGVLEIYPLASGQTETNGVRLGFKVPDIEAACAAAQRANGLLVSALKVTSWGRQATLRDLAGHVVDTTGP